METIRNINNAFGPGTANEHTTQWWFKKFCKGNKSLEGEEHSGWPLKVDNDRLRGSSKLILLKLHKKLPKNSTSTNLQLFGIWSKLERWKSSQELIANKKKIIILKYLLLFYTIIMIFQLECEAMKSRFYTTTSNDQLSGWTEKKAPKYFPKPNLCQNKVMVAVRWSAAHLIHHSFLNSRETITSEMYAQWVDEVHQKLQGLQQALIKSSVQSLSCVQLCDPMDCSTPGFPVHHQLPELALTHVHQVSDAIQSSHPLLSPSPPAFNLSQFKSINSLVLSFLYSPTLTSIHDYWKNHSFD